jgi:hypothetical protein
VNTQLEDTIRAAVSALNVSRGDLSSGWNLYTPEDVDTAIRRIGHLIDDTEHRLTTLAAARIAALEYRATLAGDR